MIYSDIILHLPEILSEGEKNALKRSVKSLSNGEKIDYTNYFETENSLPPDQLSQGDAYNELPYIELPIKKLPITSIENKPGIIISNTCAIYPGNKKIISSRVLYAPIISLDKLSNLIKEKSPESIQLIHDIKKQIPFNYFYLPPRVEYPASVVMFDHILSLDNSYFERNKLMEKLRYRLSRDSYYHFLIKLSVYLTRTTNELVSQRQK